MTAIRLSGVTGGYGDLLVVRGVDLAIPERSLTTIIGANGAGKSTLLKLIAGLLPCRDGSIALLGADVTRLGAIARLARGVGLVPQGRCNFPLLPVAENLRLGAFSRADRTEIDADLEKMTARFPILRERWTTLAGNLSGGEQQLLEMAMVLMARPRVLLLDEPSLGLSPRAMDQVFAQARALTAEGLTIVMVEQNVAQALEVSDAAVVLELGRVGLHGRADTVLHHPDIRRLFLGL
ncbi:MAG: ABC transporter ATP-binding protein [Pseudomonadota bacterium]